MMINFKTANKMIDFAAYIYAQLTQGQANEEEIKDFVADMFKSFCDFEGIDEVEIEEDDEIYDDIDDDVDEIGYNPFMGCYDEDC